MQHPFEALKLEYTQLLSAMKVKPERQREVDEVAAKVLANRRYFEDVRSAIGVPIVFSGPSFYREANLNFRDSPAQGDPWNQRARHIPHTGPYPSWKAAAIDSYSREGLQRIGDGKWTWELDCYYSELFNGFGYRDFRKMHSPYLWGGTNIQMIGKYTADDHFDPDHWDEQLGVIPIAKRIAQLIPELDIGTGAASIPAPQPSNVIVGTKPEHTVSWLQESLNRLGFDISVDGSFGRETKWAVSEVEKHFGLTLDGGYAGPEVFTAIEAALKNLETSA